MKKIDFVITWVNGQDEKWLEEKNKYSNKKIDESNSDNRFRDIGILKYWFRGVEKYASWANKIYFITYGHLPEWLNTDNPKLVIVNHEDYIPKKYLPTFNSHTIELNLHRIDGLSDSFVYFNDDMFIINDVKPENYFKNNLPVTNFYETVNLPLLKNNFSKICFNNMSVLNEEIDKRKFYRDNLGKVLSLKNGVSHILQSIMLFPYPIFSGIGVSHGSSSMLKDSYNFFWNNYYEVLDKTCLHKFRNYDLDVNQYLVKDYPTLRGNFYVRQNHFVKLINIENVDQLTLLKNILLNSKTKELCLNDNLDSNSKNFKKIVNAIQVMFQEKFPDKCSFEK